MEDTLKFPDISLFREDSYKTRANSASFLCKLFSPMGLGFYIPAFYYVWKSSRDAKKDRFDRLNWFFHSFNYFKCIERFGGTVEVSGMDNLRISESSVIFVSNHMSTLETLVLPSIILPSKEYLSIVLKEQLLKIPVFKHILKAINPIAVTRKNPIDDYKTIIKAGTERLKNDISVLVFPQTTRTAKFDPEKFNTIGVKLAKRTKKQIIPVALKTDFWGNGKMIKDLGKIDRKKTVHFAFGKPITIEGNGKQQHQQIIDFIQTKLSKWNDTDTNKKNTQ